MAELDYAVARDRPLLPVLVRDVAIQLVHPAITSTQIVDYRRRSMDSVVALMAAIASRSPAPALGGSSVKSLAFEVVEGDITAFAADLVAFKYARGFHGADRQVAQLLRTAGINLQTPGVGEHYLVHLLARSWRLARCCSSGYRRFLSSITGRFANLPPRSSASWPKMSAPAVTWP
jgi:hypothetical protein